MVVSLAGCSNGNSSESGSSANSESSSSANSEGGSDNAAAYKLGMGVVTSTASSAAGNAQVAMINYAVHIAYEPFFCS